MSYDARVFRVLIASPSDVEQERELVVSAIQAWNDLYSYARKVVLLPLRWETHTAPEYGTRPQEVINRAIVDDCDLLVGIFWTRIGSPTGVADSGTLEEIERAGKAGKPIMLYFSRIEVDPESLDLKQIEKLKEFKSNTYPRGLVEVYKKLAEFRDKFSRQLEIKVREIQQNETMEGNPFSLQLMSSETGEPFGSISKISLNRYDAPDFAEVPGDNLEAVQRRLGKRLRRHLTAPVVLGIENIGLVASRNVFVQIDFRAKSPSMELSDVAPQSDSDFMFHRLIYNSWSKGSDFPNLDKVFEAYASEVLQKTDAGWKMTLEWDVVHPGRLRIVKPYFFLYAPDGGKMEISAKIFTDSSAEPYEVTCSIEITTQQKTSPLSEILPDWKQEPGGNSGAPVLMMPDADGETIKIFKSDIA